MSRINLEIEDEMMKDKRELKVSWPQVLKAGIIALKGEKETPITAAFLKPHLDKIAEGVVAINKAMKKSPE